MESNTKNLLTIEEMAAGLKVKKSWLYRKTMEKGPEAIPRIHLGKYLRFCPESVMDWVRKQSEAALQ